MNKLAIAGMVAIGNGEKGPYCDIIIEKDEVDTVKHLLDNHAKETLGDLFDE